MRVQRKRNRLGTGGAPAGTASVRHSVREGGVDPVPGAPGELTVCVDRNRPRPVVSVTGALDTSGAALLSAMLDHVRETEGRAAVVDLTHVDYVDSHGLAPVLEADASICGASAIVTRLLDLMARSLPLAAADECRLGVPALGGARPR